jgi:F-type H+-transporting ATPase subunit epsilon
MAGTFKFELVSPEEKLISEDVTMVTIPGEEGEFGVLAGHSPLLSAVKMGVVRVNKTAMNDNPRRIFVAGGFADVGPDHCTLLAEEATDMTLVDVSLLDANIAHLNNELLAESDVYSKARIEARLAIARAKRAAI